MIPPNLQEHMIRVATVGNAVSKNWKKDYEVDIARVAKTLLVHDTGNILFFDFKTFPIPNEDHWRRVQTLFREKYGDDHAAVMKIAEEVGLDEKSLYILDTMPKTDYEHQIPDTEPELQICWYSDFRVAPQGITSLSKRLDDLIERRKKSGYPHDKVRRWERMKRYGIELDKKLREKISIDLDDISDDFVPEFRNQLVKDSIYFFQ